MLNYILHFALCNLTEMVKLFQNIDVEQFIEHRTVQK